MIISLDTETTGVDRYRGAEPFFVSICTEDYENVYWEWAVDPFTRKVQAVPADLEEIASYVDAAEIIVLQNAGFDVSMLEAVGFKNWPWHKTRDTLLSGHLLASSEPHDLTSMSLRYLGVDVSKYDKECARVVKKIRTYIEGANAGEVGEWRIARKGLPEMPSAKETVWKYDLWLPAAFAKYLQDNGLEIPFDNISWEDLTEKVPEYANNDTATTLGVDTVHQELIEERNLGLLYNERLNLLPIIFEMEKEGVTVNEERLDALTEEYERESNAAGKVCTDIAAKHSYDLVLPKGSNNKSLVDFVYSEMKLPVIKMGKKQPSLDKEVIQEFQLVLDPESDESRFVTNLSAKRKRDTAISYMRGYKRYGVPLEDLIGWILLHPKLNPTGATTLRWSSNNPNEQNISKKEGFNLRYNFGPRPGYEWWSMDAKNIELRIPFYEAGEQELIDLFEHPDDPPYYGSNHLLNFSTVYPDIWEKELAEVGFDKVGPHCKKKYAGSWYQRCKNGGFAVQYGAMLVDKPGELGTADKAFGRAGSHAKLKARFSRLEALNDHYKAMADDLGYVTTLPDRSVDGSQGYPIQCPRTAWGDVKPTLPLNYHVQSTAMWWMSRAMVRCQEQILKWREEGIYCRIVIQVHDELVFEFRRGKKETTNLPKVRKLARLMAQGGEDIGVPTPVGAELHLDNYSEGITML